MASEEKFGIGGFVGYLADCVTDLNAINRIADKIQSIQHNNNDIPRTNRRTQSVFVIVFVLALMPCANNMFQVLLPYNIILAMHLDSQLYFEGVKVFL